MAQSGLQRPLSRSSSIRPHFPGRTGVATLLGCCYASPSRSWQAAEESPCCPPNLRVPPRPRFGGRGTPGRIPRTGCPCLRPPSCRQSLPESRQAPPRPTPETDGGFAIHRGLLPETAGAATADFFTDETVEISQIVKGQRIVHGNLHLDPLMPKPECQDRSRRAAAQPSCANRRVESNCMPENPKFCGTWQAPRSRLPGAGENQRAGLCAGIGGVPQLC